MYQIDFNHPVSVYFVGIGGSGMSSLAEILSNAGFRVSGSDRSKSWNPGVLLFSTDKRLRISQMR